MSTVFEAEAVFSQGTLTTPGRLVVDANGCVAAEAPVDARVVRLPGKVLLPGFVNAHSHAFQRLIRGRTEFIAAGHDADDFWSWREAMYQAAEQLTPDEVYAVSRQAFLEMALAGITTVGEFHYLQHQADGTPYEDVALLARQVVRAAREVGLRIVLLRVGYARAGFQVAPNPRQRRFIDATVDDFVERVQATRRALANDPLVSVGIAPHSVRAVPRAWLEVVAQHATSTPLHMHVSEQPAEIRACLAESGLRPIELLAEVGLLSSRFTGVHAIHLEPNEIELLGRATANVCACPSTERNLGDGIVLADALLDAGAHVSFGTDSQAHIDLLDEGRQLEGHLRLLRLKRNVLDVGDGRPSSLGERLINAATAAGARSLGVATGTLAPGESADFVAVDLEHPSLVGWTKETLMASVALGARSDAVKDVWVQGERIVSAGRHAKQEETAEGFRGVQRRLGLR